MPGIREDWFPSSVWTFDTRLPESVREHLLQDVLAEKERDPAGMSDRSSVLGWHSAIDLHTRPAYREFCALALTNALEVVRFERWNLEVVTPQIHECWANVNERGASNLIHNHPHSILSGVYYLTAPDDSGVVFFQDPRDAPAMLAPPVRKYTPPTHQRVEYEPRPGRMLIFPSWLRHGVEPNRSDAPRVILSFNVGCEYP